MENELPIKSCDTTQSQSRSCSPCRKKMMVFVAIGIIFLSIAVYAFTGKAKYAPLVSDSNSQYQEYSAEKYNNLLGKESFALSFYASWCPTCRSQEKIIQENISSLPNNFTILRVNYDTETELKQKYGINMQSIVVIIDKQGKEIGRVGDFSSFSDLSKILPKN
jgi:thioredoxin 1